MFTCRLFAGLFLLGFARTLTVVSHFLSFVVSLRKDITDLFPHLLTPHLTTLDLSRNKKVRGDVKVFERASLDSLVDLFLHHTGVTGNYESFRSGIATGLPRLAICTLMETKVTGDLSFLPGENDRSTLDVHTVVEPAFRSPAC